MKLPLDPLESTTLAFIQDVDHRMIFDPVDGAFEQSADVLSVEGVVEVPQVAAQLVFFLEQVDFIALVGDLQSGRHAGDAASDDDRFVDDRQRVFAERLDHARIGDRHPDEVFRLIRRFRLLLHVNPGALVADVRHFEQVLVQAGLPHSLPEHRFMGSGRTGGHDDPVQVVLFDRVADLCLGVLRAGVEVVFDMNDILERSRVISHLRNIDDAADVDAAVADEYADPGFLALLRQFPADILFLTIIVPRAMARGAMASAAAPLACATVSGISFGPW